MKELCSKTYRSGPPLGLGVVEEARSEKTSKAAVGTEQVRGGKVHRIDVKLLNG